MAHRHLPQEGRQAPGPDRAIVSVHAWASASLPFHALPLQAGLSDDAWACMVACVARARCYGRLDHARGSPGLVLCALLLQATGACDKTM